MVDFLKKHQSKITSFILAIYCLPLLFQITPSAGIDGCWQRAINLAIKNGLVFGSDFIFTYGPLGYLSTRNSQYINSIVLLAGDLLLFSGYYYFIYRQISGHKKWFFLVLAAMLLLRNSYYSQNLFLIFILFVALNFRHNFRNYFELIFCSISGVLLFFIKLNYGIVSFALLFIIAFMLLVKNRKAFLPFFLPATVLFAVIYVTAHLNITGYIKYGLELIKNYDQAMYTGVRDSASAFHSAIVLISVFAVFVAAYTIRCIKTKDVRPGNVIILSMLGLACFLFYKNGFTRADFIHYNDFFSVFPFFIIGVIMILDYSQLVISKAAIIVALLLSGYILLLPDLNNKKIRYADYLNFLSPADYLRGIFNKPKEVDLPVLILHNDKLKLIGRSTVDIMPVQISLLQYNDLNYDPRPIPQSYSAYSPTLDSLNAAHFYKPSRPEIIFLQNNTIDGRYEFWDESLTKAVIRLNYGYIDFLSLVNNDSLESNSGLSYLLLRSKPGIHEYPHFEKLNECIVNMEDITSIHYADTEAIYLTADISYTFKGKIRRLFYQPPELNVTIYYDDGTNDTCKAVRSLLRQPVLINKAINNMIDLKNFFTGDIRKNKNTTGFSFHSGTKGFEQKIKLSFLKFSNY